MPCDNSRPHYRHPTESPWCVVAFRSKIAKLYQAQLGHGFLGTNRTEKPRDAAYYFVMADVQPHAFSIFQLMSLNLIISWKPY